MDLHIWRNFSAVSLSNIADGPVSLDSFFKSFRQVAKIDRLYSLRPSVRKQKRLPRDGFSRKSISDYFFSKNCLENSNFFKTWRQKKYITVLYNKNCGHLWKFPSEFFLKWENFKKFSYRNKNTHFIFIMLIIGFSNIVRSMRCGENMVRPDRAQMKI